MKEVECCGYFHSNVNPYAPWKRDVLLQRMEGEEGGGGEDGYGHTGTQYACELCERDRLGNV